MNSNLPAKVTIVEVGPRDGLQNESMMVPVEVKLQLIKLLENAGLNPVNWINQLNDYFIKGL